MSNLLSLVSGCRLALKALPANLIPGGFPRTTTNLSGLLESLKFPTRRKTQLWAAP